MTEQEYREHPAISRSELFKIGVSPEKFKYYKDTPITPTPALIFGQLLHKMVLEPDTLMDEFAVEPKVDKRTKAGKEAYAEFLDSISGKTIVSMDQFEKAEEMAQAINKNAFAVKLLGGEHEKEYFWTDDMTGEECKCRTDCTVDIGSMSLIVDLKTTTDASSEGFMREAIKYGYDFQAGMYKAGVDLVTGKDHGFVFVAVEKEPPYAVNILQADELFIKRGYDLFREYIGVYHDCKQTGDWYGYLGKFNQINKLGLPNWLKKEIE